jgi:hypothetical protein
MGGNFSSPSPNPPQVATPLPTTSEDDERKKRAALLARMRRGRSGTIKTSQRGLLAARPAAGKKPTLGG